jgi:Asp-tRNA(Asn)/Glu-tRNA(Gln) amidotransferase A subunit family amidase
LSDIGVFRIGLAAAADAITVGMLTARPLADAGLACVATDVAIETRAHLDPGKAREPWNRRHTPGGSSSGPAAAVAAWREARLPWTGLV